jgi:alpha-glucosidase (family GH31 glycosyl hydrolase)
MPLSRLRTSPRAHTDAVLQGDRWRITVLTDGLVRLEWSPDGDFEDRASTLALHRDLPVPDFRVNDSPAMLEVVTERFTLIYDRGPFTAAGLSLQVSGNVSNYHSVWRYGEPVGDLGGTARTLDNVDGPAELEGGIASRRGYAVLDDSLSFVFGDDGWVAPRDGNRLDLYVFAYGRDFQGALEAFYALSGPQPVLPRWALGNWWSRYYPYTAADYLALFDRFDAENLPFSVAVLDMDWHPVATIDPRYGSGWTGYSWNRELFPDPKAFLSQLHERGLRVTLNVHPADGVRAFEDAYPAMAEALGRDAHSGDPIAFDVTDPAFLDAYFTVLHHRLEDDGVDFWWIDWQSGRYSRVPGIDPLWMLNHFHFLDSGRDGRRPLTFSRYAGPGSHRYPVGFSGDTVVSWASLDFQPEFTATAANIGYGWWSHDVGGHMFGVRDDELTVRWVQLGVFSPILRLHSTSNPFLIKEPWLYGAEADHAMSEALRLRHRFVPYLHTMNHRAATRGRPLVRPMYHLAPTAEPAYRVPNQFAFGNQLIVAPITTRRDPVTLHGSVRAWLPPGTWTDIVTGVVYEGDRELELHRDTASIPALLREGGILPLAAADDLDATRNPERLEILFAPGADGAFVLVEDDGTGATPDTIPTARTPITWNQSEGTLAIGPVDGAADIVPSRRTWTVTALGVRVPHAQVTGVRVPHAQVTGVRVPHAQVEDLRVSADVKPDRSSVTLTDVPTGVGTRVTFGPGTIPRTAGVTERLFELLSRAQYGFEAKLAAWRSINSAEPTEAKLAQLHAQHLPDALFGAIAELLTARSAEPAGTGPIGEEDPDMRNEGKPGSAS